MYDHRIGFELIERKVLKKALRFYLENKKLTMKDELACILAYQKINDKTKTNS